MFSVFLFLASASALISLGDNSTVIEGEYIVVFHPFVTSGRRQLHMDSLEGVEVMHEYSIGTFSGYAAKFDQSKLGALQASAEIAYIEQNQVFHISDFEHKPPAPANNAQCILDTNAASWGLTRVNHRELNLDGTYASREDAGQNVITYVIDTGIYIEHEDFEGRAFYGVDTADTPPDPTDANGHGTHVAGTMIGKRYGIARKAIAYAVKVLGADGFGSTAGVIAGVDWVAQHHKQHGNKKSVANMSLGGGRSAALDNAVNMAVETGIIFVVAAGNDGWLPWLADACNYSPAAATKATTVASSDVSDRRSGFSNYGVCVDIFAPGSDITSAWIGSPTASLTISGTSMASPHVAGVMAKYWTHHPDKTAEQVEKDVQALATVGILSDTRDGTPNKLLFANCDV